MDDIFVYRVKLPNRHRKAVMACSDGYTGYIDEDLDDIQAIRAYRYAMMHIRRGDCDWKGDCVQQIEEETHTIQK